MTTENGVVTGQISSQPECNEWTQSQLFENNTELQVAEEEYFDTVASTLDAGCFNDDDTLKKCQLDMDEDSSESQLYIDECTTKGGNIWSYTFQPSCADNDDLTHEVEDVLVCASSDCVDIGVSNLIPEDSFLDPFVARNYTCGKGFSSLKLEYEGSGAGPATVFIGRGGSGTAIVFALVVLGSAVVSML